MQVYFKLDKVTLSPNWLLFSLTSPLFLTTSFSDEICGRSDTFRGFISDHKRIGGHFKDGRKQGKRRDPIYMSAQMQRLLSKNLHNNFDRKQRSQHKKILKRKICLFFILVAFSSDPHPSSAAPPSPVETYGDRSPSSLSSQPVKFHKANSPLLRSHRLYS